MNLDVCPNCLGFYYLTLLKNVKHRLLQYARGGIYSSQNIIYLFFGWGNSEVYKKEKKYEKQNKKNIKNNRPLQILFSKTRDGNSLYRKYFYQSYENMFIPKIMRKNWVNLQ